MSDLEAWDNYRSDAVLALGDIEQSLLELESHPEDTESLNRLYRALHSIKGNSGFLELGTVETLAHAGEDLIGLVRDGGVPLDREIVDIMLGTIDVLRTLIEKSCKERGDVPRTDGYERLLDQLHEALSLRGGAAPLATGDAWGIFSVAPEPGPDVDELEIFLALAAAVCAKIGECFSGLEGAMAGDARSQELLQHCAEIRGAAERVGLVRVVDAVAALERAAVSTDAATRSEAELRVYDCLVEVEDYVHTVGARGGPRTLRLLLAEVAAGAAPIELTTLLALAATAHVPKHGAARWLFRKLALACEHHGFHAGVERVLDLNDRLLRVVEQQRTITEDLRASIRRLVTDIESQLEEARAGDEGDIAEPPPDPVVVDSELPGAISEVFRPMLRPETLATWRGALARGWELCEVEACGVELEAENALRMLFSTGTVELITSASKGPEARYLVATSSREALRLALGSIDPTRRGVRLAGDAPEPAAPVVASPKPVAGPAPAAAAGAAAPATALRRTSSRPPPAARGGAAGDDDKQTEFLRVDARKVSLLMDLASEIGLACGAVTHHAALEGLELEGYSAAAHKLELLVREMQNEMSGMRLVPVNGVFQRMKRVVRDSARRTGKEVDLVLEGEETEIDKIMVDALQDPLVHVLRNAIDHGIEAPDARVAAGKPRAGRVVLSASHQGGEVSIEVSDDGAGMNRAKILARGKERGIVAPDATLTDAQILDLVFEPGFSTKDRIDELSGRGVGMDVVKTTIASLRGRVGVKSVDGRGSRLTMTMPLTLAFVEAMVVRERERLFALPIEKVFEVFRTEAAQVSRSSANGHELLRVRDKLVPVLWLHRFWEEHPGEELDVVGRIVVVIQTSQGEFALPVDTLLGNQQVMLKPLRGPLAGIRAAAGCGMLRSGDVALALDCEQLHA